VWSKNPVERETKKKVYKTLKQVQEVEVIEISSDEDESPFCEQLILDL
jgi:uncharacterized protein (DUF2249 family)